MRESKGTKESFFRGLPLIVVMFIFFLTGTASASQWAISYGGGYTDKAYSIQQTSDGDYIMAGSTTSFGAGLSDAWVLKLDENGNVLWQKTYGGSNYDYANSIQQTSDGYVFVGYTESFGAGGKDFWVLKLDTKGYVQWQKTYGGSGNDYANSIQQTSDGGYIMAGSTQPSGNLSDAWVLKLDENGNVLWQKTYGGSNYDYANSIQQTSDGGYIVAGKTFSFGAGLSDAWVLKLDENGNVLWQKTYGGNMGDYANSIQQTSDGGYIVGGITYSFHTSGFWVLKLDENGNVLWQKTYAGSDEEFGFIQQTLDGGYIMAGSTTSFGAGGNDFRVLKLGENGNVLGQRTYGGSGDDYGASIQPTSDGGFIVAGQTSSFGAGSEDFLLLKLDANVEIPYCSAMGGSLITGHDSNATIIDTTVTGTVTTVSPQTSTAIPADTNATATELCYYTPPISPIIGYTPLSFSYTATQGGSNPSNRSLGIWNAGVGTLSWSVSDNATWLSLSSTSGTNTGNVTVSVNIAGLTAGTYNATITIAATGATNSPVNIPVTLSIGPISASQWVKSYGGSGYDWDWVESIQQTSDGGYIMAGDTTSFGAGGLDAWILKLDENGYVQWQKTYGRGAYDSTRSIHPTLEGGYIVAGYTGSSGAGGDDFWVLKLDTNGYVQWQKTYGGSNQDYANSIQQTSDGYVVVGYTTSFGAGGNDFWVLKLDTNGYVQWQKTYGGSGNDYPYSIHQTLDGGYIVAGSTNSFGTNYDVWVLKLDESGDVVWQKTYGGSGGESASFIHQTLDGGYIVAGSTTSFGAGGNDFWVLKLDENGNVLWQKTYGQDGTDYVGSIQQTSDGGYIVGGVTYPSHVYPPFVDRGFWVLKLDENGNLLWQKTYIASGAEIGFIQQTLDGGYIMAGPVEYDYGDDFDEDAWVLKLDANGEIPDCSLIGVSSATVGNTNATINDTTVTGIDTNVVQQTSTAYIINTNATVTEVCYSGGGQTPVIDKILGVKEPGLIISIIGTNFGDTQGDSVVHIGARTFDSSSPRIKLWSDTKIRIKLPNYQCGWFQGQGYRYIRVWVTVDGVDSNKKRIKVLKPATCP